MRYAFQKLVRLVLVFVIVTFMVLVGLRIGLKDPAQDMLGGFASPELIKETTAKFHLNDNYVSQYVFWAKGAVTGDFGPSTYNRPVAEQLKTSVLSTVLLGLYAIVFAFLVALPIAIFSAYRRNGIFDKVAGFFTFAFISLPSLVLGVLLTLTIGSSGLNWFPRLSDKIWPWDALSGHFHAFFLPTLALAIPLCGIFIRLLRADLTLTLQNDFITLARAKGVSPRRILLRHALRSSLFSVITSVSLQIGNIIGGAVAIEVLFQLKGMGFLLADAVFKHDFLVVQACAALLVLGVVFTNFVVDMVYAVIDPRIRQMRALA